MACFVAETTRCPFCGETQPTWRFGYYPAPNSQHARLYRCPRCRLFFAPLTEEPERSSIDNSR